MAMTIRPLAADDRARWEDLFGQYFDFYKMAPRDGGLESVWKWIFDPDNDFWCDVAEDETGKVVGLVHYQLMHNSLRGAMSCYLADLFVDPDVRGSGIGRRLIDHVLAFAKDNGLPSVHWLTQEHNYAGRRLYDRYGPKTEFILYRVGV